MQKYRCNGIQYWTIGNIGTVVAQHIHNAIGDGPARAGQVIRQTVGGVHKGGQHDRLLRELRGAKDLHNGNDINID